MEVGLTSLELSFDRNSLVDSLLFDDLKVRLDLVWRHLIKVDLVLIRFFKQTFVLKILCIESYPLPRRELTLGLAKPINTEVYRTPNELTNLTIYKEVVVLLIETSDNGSR